MVRAEKKMIRRANSRPAVLAVALLSASALWATNKGPDSGGYSATDAAVYSFIAINGAGGASVLGGTDDAVALVSLPFSFQFYGTSYTQLCISSNGQAFFVTSSAACVEAGDFANTDLTLAGPPGNLPAIMPYWTDLTLLGAGSAVYYQTQGTVGSRRFIIEWYNASVVATSSAATFEAILTEGSNQILFQYLTVDSGQGNSATVGIRNSNGQTNGQQIEWSYNAAVLSNNYAILSTAPQFSACDLKQTGTITVADVQLIINEALGVSPAVNDLNGDGVVNVIDVQIEINAALGLGCAAK
jgi:hypothetical protein